MASGTALRGWVAFFISTRHYTSLPSRRPGRPPPGRAQSAAERMRRSRARGRGAGLRVATRWQPATSAAISPGLLKHRIIEARSLAMHCLIARKVEADRRLLAATRRNLAKWIARYGEDAPRALDEWREILHRPWPEIAALITAADASATRLRPSSPVAGVLTPPERPPASETARALAPDPRRGAHRRGARTTAWRGA